MPQPRIMNPDDLHGLQVIDTTGDTIGKVATVYLDVEHHTPEWAAVSTGLFGTHVSLVPLVNDTTTGPLERPAIDGYRSRRAVGRVGQR